jgi:tetratricopeptide (TPR) repeat protein
MASLVSGYENDIFISYRQNDNKYDGWVTTFVHNLTLELEATIKEKVSVYFDINPTDGLLETHSVDKSLEDKLKCLIFIPIISRTYCDINSFAWQHEFRAFNSMAAEDKLGRHIKLPGGNFASRILPVKIHELDADDKMLLENELGGPLRSIDFIYRSPGVNRPLGAFEDHPHDNLNNTYYRDQINKVANAIYEILAALKYQSARSDEKIVKKSDNLFNRFSRKQPGSLFKRGLYPDGKKIWASLAVIALLIFALNLIYPALKQNEAKKEGLNSERTSIVVMPFHNLSNDSSLNYLRLGGQEGIVAKLSFYPEELNVRSSELVRNFLKNENIAYFSSMTAFSGSRISKKLDADVFLLGGIYKNGEKIRLSTQLINSKTKEIIRPFQVEGYSENIMYSIDSLAEMVRDYLTLSSLDKKFKSTPGNIYKLQYLTKSPEAYRYHFLALEAFYSFDYNTSIRLDSQAVAIDSNFVAAIVTLCWGNFSNGNYKKATEWLLKAYKKKDQMPLLENFRLDYQYSSLFQTPVEQIRCLKQLQKIDDNNPRYYQALGYLYVSLSKYNEAVSEFEKAEPIYKRWGSDPTDLYYYQYIIKAYNETGQKRRVRKILHIAEKQFITKKPESKTGDEFLKIAVIYSNADAYDQAEKYFKKAVSVEPGNPNIIYNYAASLIENDLNIEEGLKLIDTALELNPDNGAYLDTKGWGLYKQHKYEEARRILARAYEKLPSFEIKAHIDSVEKAWMKQK